MAGPSTCRLRTFTRRGRYTRRSRPWPWPTTHTSSRTRQTYRRRAVSGEGFGHLLDQCLGIRAGEQIVLLTDDGTDQGVVTGLLESVAARDGIALAALMPAPRLPGAEPPRAVAAT